MSKVDSTSEISSRARRTASGALAGIVFGFLVASTSTVWTGCSATPTQRGAAEQHTVEPAEADAGAARAPRPATAPVEAQAMPTTSSALPASGMDAAEAVSRMEGYLRPLTSIPANRRPTGSLN